MPPEATDAFFKSREKIEKAFNQNQFGISQDGRFSEWFQPQEDVEYFVHVDLAQKHDHCAVALAHIDSWVSMKIGGTMTQAAPNVVVDAIRYWTPTSTKSVDFTEVKDFIIELRNRGFRLKMVTFDRWNSHDMMQQLKAHGINTELLSVAKKHYEDMAMLVTEERLTGPAIKLLVDELLQLRIIRDKVDHPRKGSKDLADATVGAVYNAISRSTKGDREIKIHSYSSLNRDIEEKENKKRDAMGVISSPNKEMPAELQNALDNMKIL
jgi:phage terminase large subunit-like protein